MSGVNQILGALAAFGALASFARVVQAQRYVFPKECVDCHGSETKYPVRGDLAQYVTSGHSANGQASYANSEGDEEFSLRQQRKNS